MSIQTHNHARRGPREFAPCANQASGERPLASGETRVVTSGDVIKMMERAGMITEDA